MRLFTGFVTAAVILFFLAGTAAAVEENKSKGPKVQKFEEVERGFWIKSTFGM